MLQGQNFSFIPSPMTPDVVIAGNIEIYENVWQDCQQVIEAVETTCAEPNSGVNWTRATTIGDGAYQSMRTNWDLGITHYMDITGNQLMRDLHNRLSALLMSAGTSYSQRHGIEEAFWQEGYNLLKYQVGQEYKAHYDGGTVQGRHISCVLYLNDDYTGGEIEFPSFNVKIKPQAGMLIMFPSNFAYRHIAHPVITGTKYAAVTWLHDRPL